MLIHSSYKFDSYRIFHTSVLFQILVLCSRRNCYFPLMLSAADVFFSVLPVMKMSSHVTWEYILMIFTGLRLLCWEVSSNARSLSLPSFLSDVLHHDLLTPSKFQILECFFMILTNQGYHSKTAIHVNTAFAQWFQIFFKNFCSCCFRQCSHQIVSGYVSDVYRLN